MNAYTISERHHQVYKDNVCPCLYLYTCVIQVYIRRQYINLIRTSSTPRTIALHAPDLQHRFQMVCIFDFQLSKYRLLLSDPARTTSAYPPNSAAPNLSPPPNSCRRAILCSPVFFCVLFHLEKSRSRGWG